MKKVLSVLAVSALVFGFSSCKKSGECTCEVLGQTASQKYEDVDSDAYDAAKASCEGESNDAAAVVGGSCTWSDI